MKAERECKRGFWSLAPASWTKEDYKTVLREIALADQQNHAVSYDKLRNMLGKRALLSMVEWNLMALRRKSSWAKDVPETIYTIINDEKLVVMPSPAELYWVLKMHKDGKLDAATSSSKMKRFFEFYSFFICFCLPLYPFSLKLV